jgi:predicted GNAT family acetyltransferase
VAIADGQLAGFVTYAVRDEEPEIVTVQVEHEDHGVGRALIEAVLGHARDEGVRRIWLVTTDDNLRALGFYQRWGMDLAALIRDRVSTSRLVEPSIPGSEATPSRFDTSTSSSCVSILKNPAAVEVRDLGNGDQPVRRARRVGVLRAGNQRRPWGDGEPAPNLVTLRKEVLSR